MEVIRSRAFFGCNLFSGGPAAHFLVGGSPNETAALAAWCFADWGRFDAALGSGVESDETTSSQSATPYDSESLCRTAITTLAQAFGRTASAVGLSAALIHLSRPDNGQYELAFTCDDADLLTRAGAITIDVLSALCHQVDAASGVVQEARERLRGLQQLVQLRRLSATQAAILAVARERDIPVVRFDRWPFVSEGSHVPLAHKGLMQLGQGVYAQTLREAEILTRRPKTNEQLQDRVAMHIALRARGVPVPAQDTEFTNLNSARRAVRSAERLGYPAVLKPRYRRHPGGVLMHLGSPEAVAAAFAAASRVDHHVVVEQQVPGAPYRLLVIGGDVVAASQTSEPNELLPWARALPLASLAPAVVAAASNAAEAFQLEVAQVTIVTADPAVPLEHVGGTVLSVDVVPYLGLHRGADEVLPIAAAREFLRHLFPDGQTGRIPILAVTGSAGKTTTSRMLGRICEAAGHTVGLACTDGVYVGGTQLTDGVRSGVSGALQVLTDPSVQVAVLEVSRGTLIEKGLGYDWSTAGACTKVQAEHLGLNGVETLSDMARFKGLVVERAAGTAVVNAQDHHCMQMLNRAPANRKGLVSTDPHAPALNQRLSSGNFAVVLEENDNGGQIDIWEKSGKYTLMSVDEIPAAWRGAAAHNVENAMFAAALSLGINIPVDAVRRGLASFRSSPQDAPNRLNRYESLPFTVLLDRAGTTPAYAALCDFVDRVAPTGRKILAFFGTGDRRDQDLRAAAVRVAASFDHFVCFDSANLRGRRPMEVPELFQATLSENDILDEDIVLCPDKREAVKYILTIASPGDFVVIATGAGLHEVLRYLDQAAHARRSCSQ